MAAKRGRMDLGHSRFAHKRAKESYDQMCSWGFTESRVLRQEKLSYPISDLFVYSPLLFILTLAFPYFSDWVREFYAGFSLEDNKTRIRSRVGFRDVIFSKEEIGNLLNTSIEGVSPHRMSISLNWTQMNLVLRNSNYNKHISTVKGLIQEARVVQHVLRHTIIPKAGDRTNITPLLSATTYLILSRQQFDVGDLIIRYMENIVSFANPSVKRKHNLGLGHIIAYLLQTKYDLPLPSTLDHNPIYFSDGSFHILYSTKSKGKKIVDEEGEEEEEAAEAEEQEGVGEASAPPPHDGDDITTRLGRIEFQMNENSREIKELNKRIEKYHEEDRIWMQEQFDSIRDYFGGGDDE